MAHELTHLETNFKNCKLQMEIGYPEQQNRSNGHTGSHPGQEQSSSSQLVDQTRRYNEMNLEEADIYESLRGSNNPSVAFHHSASPPSEQYHQEQQRASAVRATRIPRSHFRNSLARHGTDQIGQIVDSDRS